MSVVRIQGWEGRLAGAIAAGRRPYKLGEHDCFRFACAAVEALIGVDLWAPWAGRYRTKRQALRLLKQYAGEAALELGMPYGSANVFTLAFSRLFGAAPEAIARAQRGDVAEYVDGAGEQHLGIVNGARVVVLLESGLGDVPRSSCAHAWRIG